MDHSDDQGDLSPELATLEKLRDSGRHSLLDYLAQEPGSPLVEYAPGLFTSHKDFDMDRYDRD
jgi:hypothetical protein